MLGKGTHPSQGPETSTLWGCWTYHTTPSSLKKYNLYILTLNHSVCISMLSVKKKIPLGGKDRISSFPRWVFHHVRPGVFSRSPLSPIRSDRCLIDIRCWSLSFVIWMPPENWSTNQQVTSIQYLKSLCYTHKAVISSSFHKSHLSQPTPGKLHKKTHKTRNSVVRRGRAPKVANHRGSLLSSGSNKPIEDEGKVFGAKNQPHQWVVSWWSLVWGEGKNIVMFSGIVSFRKMKLV